MKGSEPFVKSAGQHLVDALLVSLGDQLGTAKTAFTAAGHLLVEVVEILTATADLAGAGFLEPLFCPGVGLHLVTHCLTRFRLRQPVGL